MIETKLLNAYVSELEALRTHGRDFAQNFPDIAARLDIGPRRSRDPQVERVVESAAFLAARLRMMIEDSATELPMTLLSMLAPTLLDPVPSLALAEFRAGTEDRTVPRGTRFDYQSSGQSLVCFSTTMDVTVAPLSLRLRRFRPSSDYPDGIAVHLSGQPTERLLLFLGNDDLSAAVLMDALAEDLAVIEVAQPGAAGSTMVSPRRLRFHGLTGEDASLPIRPAAHQAYRILTEFMVFPEKFRFVSLDGLPLIDGTEVRFWFSRPLALAPTLPPGLITTNRVPVVNLWPSAATPFDVAGNQLEYPVRVDAQRYRTVECHSVENVDLYGPEGGDPVRLDPTMGLGDIRGTAVRWGTRRSVSRAGGEVMLYFQGLDYQVLGQQRFLAAPHVLASNRDLPQRIRAGSRLHPVESMGDWRCMLASVPTEYRPALIESEAMRTLTGYLQGSVHGMTAGDRRGSLRDYLRRFPGGRDAAWVDAIGRIAFRQVASVRDGFPQTGLTVFIAFDALRSRTTSHTTVRRVLAELFESQRGLNRIEEVIVVSD